VATIAEALGVSMNTVFKRRAAGAGYD